MTSVRAFVAVHLDSATRAALADAVADLRAHAIGLPVAWVPPENFHITLKFLGGVGADRVPAIVDALRAALAGRRAFELQLAGLGAFPAATRPRVLWAGVVAGRDALAILASAVDDAMAGVGFEREGRDFSPHVTLARIREPRRAPALASALAAATRRAFGSVAIDRVALMQSHLSPRGARYTELTAVPLTA